ncbi:CAP domain-containing protein [Nicoliella lavandulae]|uniref:CAP domain-containing protein n=1 Tax=Nicoliella lavandulae TaxID=3082954 RepID=A0ABU8SLZ0_9LACO
MNKKRIISLFTIMLLGSVSTAIIPSTITYAKKARVKKTGHKKVKHIHVDANHKYYVAKDSSTQIMDDRNFEVLKKDDDSNGGVGPSVDSGYNGLPVIITKRENVGGYLFYKIKDESGFNTDTGWTYSGNVADSPNAKAHSIDLEKVETAIDKEHSQTKINNFNQQELANARAKTLALVNQDRASVGLGPLTESNVLDQIAQQRAVQTVTDFSHFNANGQGYFELDAQQMGISSDAWAENLAQASGKNGDEAAQDANDEWWTQEKGSTPDQDGGHRKNIRSTDVTNIGIGITYDQNSDTWYLVEDFTGDINLNNSSNYGN